MNDVKFEKSKVTQFENVKESCKLYKAFYKKHDSAHVNGKRSNFRITVSLFFENENNVGNLFQSVISIFAHFQHVKLLPLSPPQNLPHFFFIFRFQFLLENIKNKNVSLSIELHVPYFFFFFIKILGFLLSDEKRKKSGFPVKSRRNIFRERHDLSNKNKKGS